MAGGIDAAHANQLLAVSLATGGSSTSTTTYPVRMRLMTANGSDVSAGSELPSGGSYVAGSGISLAGALGAPSSQTVSNSAVITQTNMPAVGSPGIQGAEFWDSAGTPARKWWGPLTVAKTFNAGDTFTVAIAGLSINLA
jgi:hypothetical protein